MSLRSLVHITLLFFAISGCEVSETTTGKKLLYEVEKSVKEPEADYIAYHVTESLTELHWKVESSSLLAKSNEEGNQVYGFRFRYRVFPNYSTKTPIDSGTVVMKDVAATKDEFVSGLFELNMNKGYNYVVQVNLYDLNRNSQSSKLTDVYKAETTSRNYFETFDSEGQRLYHEYVNQPGEYSVQYNSPQDELWLKYYDREFTIASAPFTTTNPKPFDFNPDSMRVIKRSSDGLFHFDIIHEGFYLLAPDSAKPKGLTLFYHGFYYPDQKTVLDLIGPLRYITTNQEYDRLSSGDNLKKSVDEFWLSIGGSPDRTRSLIKAFYNRVEFSNRNFASYLEGWKSERGMCFIVFGQPDQVYRSTSSEKWIYGESGRYNALTLTFTKVSNPFTNNDFRLNRSSSLKTPWYRAVEFWRQGRVVNYR